MSAADSSALNCWSWAYALGEWLVIIGVAFEGAEMLSRRSAKRKIRQFIGPLQAAPNEPITPEWAHNLGDLGFILLVIGLVLAQLSHVRMASISDREQARLTKQLDSTTEQSGKAIERAAQANERTATTESNNLVLRSNLAALELKIQRRGISPANRTNLIACLKDAPKFGVETFSAFPDDEATSFKNDIAGVLTEAGFSVREHVETNRIVLSVPWTGVSFVCKDASKIPIPMLTVLLCFRSNDIPALFTPTDQIHARASNDLVIVVGPRF